MYLIFSHKYYDSDTYYTFFHLIKVLKTLHQEKIVVQPDALLANVSDKERNLSVNKVSALLFHFSQEVRLPQIPHTPFSPKRGLF